MKNPSRRDLLKGAVAVASGSALTALPGEAQTAAAPEPARSMPRSTRAKLPFSAVQFPTEIFCF